MREEFAAEAGNELTEKLRSATVAEYVDWIEKYIKGGHKVNGIYGISMQADSIKIVTAPCSYHDLRGVDGLSIIVPGKFETGGTYPPEGSNNKFLCMPSGRYKANGWPDVVLYKDTIAELKKRGYSRRAIKKMHVAVPKWGRKSVRQELNRVFSEAPRAPITAKLARKIPGLH